MNTYKVMMANEMGDTKVSIIVAAGELSGMQFAEVHNNGFKAKFELTIINGSPAA